jgi:hypothetical protein
MAPAANLDRRALSGDAIDRAVAQASIAARKEYVRFGHPMPVWQDGRLLWVSPQELAQLDSVGDTLGAGAAVTS